MVEQRYRWDFIGLSTDEKPTASTSPKVTDGSTYYCSDNSKLYVWYNDRWYERKALGGGGGGGGTSYTAGTGITIDDDTISVDTTTIQAKLTAGSNVTISDDTISATDTTYSAFTGTDGTAAGVAGLVPAPATTDAGKFLKADGTWGTAGGGGSTLARALTSSDYNYPVANPNSINPGMLAPGMYFVNDNSLKVFDGVNALAYRTNTVFIVSGTAGDSTNTHDMVVINSERGASDESYKVSFYYVDVATGLTRQRGGALGYGLLDGGYVVDNLNYTTNDSNRVLAAKQGNVLKNMITPTTGSGAPTSSTTGALGKVYIDTTTATAYMCVESSGGSQTWKQITA